MSTPRTPDSILHAILHQKEDIPAGAIQAADGFQEELIPRLIRWLNEWVAGPKAGGLPSCAAPLCVLLLLARWRRREAFPSVLRWIDTPVDNHRHLHTMVSDFGPAVLAMVWDEKLETITRLVRDTTLSEIARDTALMVPVLACEWGRLEPALVHEWQKSLLSSQAFPKGHELWVEFVLGCIRAGNKAIHPHLAKAYSSGWLPSEYISPNEWVYGLSNPPGEGNDPIDDVACEASGWIEDQQVGDMLCGAGEDDFSPS